MKGTIQPLPSRRARASALSLLLVSALAAITTPAHADALAKPTNAVAREYLTTGNRYYRLREFEKAIAEYKAGAAREDVPVFHYNLGQCYRQLGRYEDAIWHYGLFLERGKPTGEVETSVRDFIAQMKGELEKKAMQQPPIEPAPGSQEAAAQPAAALPPSGPPPEGDRGLSSQRKLAIAIGAAGVAVVGLGVGFGLRARSFEDDAADICPGSPCERPDEANALIDRGTTSARYANVFYGIGGAAIVGAAVLWFLDSAPERKRTAIVPQASATSVGIAAALTF